MCGGVAHGEGGRYWLSTERLARIGQRFRADGFSTDVLGRGGEVVTGKTLSE
jgi:hypothetical protein